MVVSFATYERVALADSDALWEMVCGRLQEKPPMTQAHNSLASRLVTQLVTQLDEDAYEVRMNAPALRVREGTYRIPDVAVVPQQGLTPGTGLETYDAPLLLVAEVWSPSTGGADSERKIPEYMDRGDLEVWQIHPNERAVTTWVRQPDGSYAESTHREGELALAGLPNVRVDLTRLFR